MLVLGAVLAVVVGGAVAAEWGDEGADPSGTGPGATGTSEPGEATTTTLGPIKEAPEDSVCRLLSHREAETLVGHDLPHEVVQLPLDGVQCSWPDEKGKVVGQLYFVVKEREPVPLAEVVRHDWQPKENFRFRPVEGLGEEAILVVQRDPGFAVGLDVHFRDIHVILGNGARDVWSGTEEEKRRRLRQTMETVLDRMAQRLERLERLEDLEDGA